MKEEIEKIIDKNWNGREYDLNAVDTVKDIVMLFSQTLQELRKEIEGMRVDDEGLVSTWEAGNNDAVNQALSIIDRKLNELVQT